MSGRWTAGVRREVLPNGLTLLVQPEPGSPAVAVVTLVRAGFLDEPDRWAGISHVLEHMFFKGTPRRGVGAVARETKAAGGYLNAGTGYEHTAYYTVLPARSLPAALDIQADALRHASLDPGELRRELQVIIEEARRKRDSPGAMAHETLHAVLFDHHRIRRWRIGEEDRLAGFTREDVAGYYRTRYVPSRTIVAIVGGVDTDEALDLARRQFGDWEDAPAALDPPVAEPWRHERRVRTLRGDVTQADLVLGWRGPPERHPDAPALEMAAMVLASGRSSWLQQSLRDPGVVLSVGAGTLATSDIGVFSISADLAPDRMTDCLEGMARAVERLARRGPSALDLERARTLARARWARWLEAADSRAAALAQAEAIDGVDWLDRSEARLQEVTGDEIRAAAAEWLRPDAVSAVAYLPQAGGADLQVADLDRHFARRAPAAAPRREGATYHLALPGADLLVRRKPGAPVVSLRLHRPRGGPEPAALAGVGTLAVRSAVRGAGGLDAPTLALAFERLGGPVSGHVTADAFGYAATVLPEHFLAAADLLCRVLWEPTLAEPVVRVEREILQREAAQVADDMVRFPFQLALGAAFRDAGYGVPVGGVEESLAGLDPAAPGRWLEQELGLGRTLLVAVGDFDTTAAADSLGELLQARPSAAPAPGRAPTPVAPLASDRPRVALRQRAQTALAMVFPGPARSHPARFAAEVWAAVSGGLGGRLFEALRDRRSLGYSVMASSWQRAGAGALLTYIATSPEREDEARDAMLGELAALRDEGLSGAELERAIAYLAGQAEVSRQTGGAISAALVDHWLAGEPLAQFEEPGAPYRAVTAEAVQELMRECLDPEARAEGVVRGIGGGKDEGSDLGG